MKKKQENNTDTNNGLMARTIYEYCDRSLDKCPKCPYKSECNDLVRAGVPKLYQFSDGSFILAKPLSAVIASALAR